MVDIRSSLIIGVYQFWSVRHNSQSVTGLKQDIYTETRAIFMRINGQPWGILA